MKYRKPGRRERVAAIEGIFDIVPPPSDAYIKVKVSFAKETYKRDCILQKRPII